MSDDTIKRRINIEVNLGQKGEDDPENWADDDGAAMKETLTSGSSATRGRGNE